MSLIDKLKRIEINRMHSSIDKKILLFTDLLLRVAICQDLNLKNNELRFETTNYGKPYLANNEGYYFTVSNTHNMIAVGIADRRIGVDVERIREPDVRMLKRLFSQREQDYINSRPDGLCQDILKSCPRREHT